MPKEKIKTVISCFQDGDPTPLGFSWSKTLAENFPCKYRQTILLHGDCLKYGLNNSAYQARFGVENPFASFLYDLYRNDKVRIVICQLCLNADGFAVSQLLPFIQPIAFSVDYIAESQAKRGAVIIYDSKLAAKSYPPIN
jgi:hypothetical protein